MRKSLFLPMVVLVSNKVMSQEVTENSAKDQLNKSKSSTNCGVKSE